MKRRNKTVIEAEIDRAMKEAFTEVAQEPLPDHLVQLVKRLRAGDAASKAAPDTSDGLGDEEA